MKIKKVRLMAACILTAFLAGCSRSEGKTEPATVVEISAAADAGETANENDIDLPVPEEKEEPEESVDYRVTDISGLVRTEAEIDPTVEDRQAEESVLDTELTDTVEYVESDREEIMKTRLEESVVNENDPATYTVVQREQEVSVEKEIPEEYTDSSGNVKYEYVDGVWYSYKYSIDTVTMGGEKDVEGALAILNMFGDYDGYTVQKVDCSEGVSDTGDIEYTYKVFYRKAKKMQAAPSDATGLTVTRVHTETVVEKQLVEEKIPVMLEKKTRTGTYTYYGWQELDGDTYYFDKYGEKVTGMQVIRGIRCLFDEDGKLQERSGVSVSSRNGAINWKKVYETGIDFAMIRCGYRGSEGGMLVKDARCEENLRNAQGAGLKTGIWFYSQAVTEKEAVEEASFLISMAEKYHLSFPPAVAVGYTAGYQGRADGLSTEDRSACMKAFCRTVESAGYTPMICAGDDWLEVCLDRKLTEEYPLWLAQYNSSVTYTGDFDLWQYTAKGKVDGISGYTSLNMIYEK